MMMEEIGRTGTPSPRFSNMLPTKPSDTGKSKSAADKPTGPEFRYLSHILWGLLPPLLIMLAYGGRPTLIALCFGCIFTYIFDLLGTMEAAVLSVAVTCMAIWGTLIFASRYLLQESLFHTPVLGTMTLLLLLTFFTVGASFQSLLIEFETFFILMESVILATLPLLASTIITWFICIELPVVDMSFCFSTIFFLYMMTLCIPRIQSNSTHFAVPLSTLTTLYIVPILVSVALHISLHHSVTMTSSTRIGDLFISALYPILLVILIAEKHNSIVHFIRNETVSADMQRSYFVSKVTVVCLLVLCMQIYSVFADIKAFSAVGEPYASILVSALLLLSCGALLGTDDFAVAMCWTLVSLLGGIILGLELSTFALAGSVAVMYTPVKGVPMRVLQTLGGLLLAAIPAYFYASKTLTFLLFSMTWHGSEIPVQSYVNLGVIALLLAIGVPMLLPRMEKSLLAMHIPASNGTSNSITDTLRDGAVGICIVIFTVLVSALELMLREQDWADIGAEVEAVYPSYLLVTTAVVLMLTSLHLAHVDKIRPMVCWHVLIVQGCKLLHLVGYPSRSCVVLCAFLLAISRPFVAYYREILESLSDVPITPSVAKSMIHPATTAYYLISVAGTCYWVASTIAPYILFTIMHREVSSFEVYTSMIGVWSLFAGFVAFVFYRDYATVRSTLLLLSIACVLLVSGAFEWVTLRYDTSSPLLVSLQLHPDINHAAVDRTVVYMFLAFGIAIAGTINLVNVQKPLMRLFFVAALTFCSGQALHGWCFPVTAGVVLDNNAVWYLWIYSFGMAFFTITTCMHTIAVKAAASGTGSVLLICNVVCPFVILAVDFFFTSGFHSMTVCVSTSVVFGIEAIVTRLAIVSHQQALRKRASHKEEFYFGDTVGSVAALVCFVFAVVSSGANAESKADFVIPAASLVFLTLRSDDNRDAVDPKKVVPLICCVWWSLSAFYAILLKGGGENVDIFAAYVMKNSGHWFLYEGDISIWSEDNILIALMHLGLMILTLPSIFLAHMNSKVSEDAMFVLAILSVLPVILSFVWSVRLLGVAGALFGAWSCYSASAAQRKSDMVI